MAHHHELTISNLSDRLLGLTKAFEALTSSPSTSRHANAQGGPTPRSVKINFPCFDVSDPEGWLYLVEEYFTFHAIGDDSKVQMAGLHMMGTALAWICGLRRNRLITTWPHHVEDLREQFGIDIFENKLEELTRLQQTTSVANYIDRFEALLNEVDGQDEKALITYFGRGLTEELRRQLKISRLGTLREAFATAKVYEAHLGRGIGGGQSGGR